jgi:hypothetical protein
VALGVVLAIGALGSPAIAGEATTNPATIRAQRLWVRWALGSDTNPFLTPGFCRERMASRYFFTATVQPSTEVDCRIRQGTPVLASWAGTAFWSTGGSLTPAELEAAVADDLALYSDVTATLDGKALDVDAHLKSGGTYRIEVGEHSFIRAVDPDFPDGAGSARIASGGWFARIRHLPVGEHELVVTAEYDGDPLDITYHIQVTAA